MIILQIRKNRVSKTPSPERSWRRRLPFELVPHKSFKSKFHTLKNPVCAPCILTWTCKTVFLNFISITRFSYNFYIIWSHCECIFIWYSNKIINFQTYCLFTLQIEKFWKKNNGKKDSLHFPNVLKSQNVSWGKTQFPAHSLIYVYRDVDALINPESVTAFRIPREETGPSTLSRHKFDTSFEMLPKAEKFHQDQVFPPTVD